MKTDKKLSIEDIIQELKDDKESKEPLKAGLLPLDLIFPYGINDEVIQIAGDSGTGKTLLALELAKVYCNQGRKVLYLNTQNSVNRDRLEQYNLNQFINTQFFIFKEQTFKKSEELLDKFIGTDELDLVIVDSIANLVNDGYLNLKHEGKSKGISIDNYNSNYDTRPLSLFIRKYSALASNKHFTLVLVSSMRQKVHKTLGTIEKRFGPKSLDGCCSTIIKINKPKSSKFYKTFENLNQGTSLEFEVIKSNTINPNFKIPYYLVYAYGIDELYNLVYYLIMTNAVKQTGAYYSFAGTDTRFHGIGSLIEEISKVNEPFMHKYRKLMEDYYVQNH